MEDKVKYKWELFQPKRGYYTLKEFKVGEVVVKKQYLEHFLEMGAAIPEKYKVYISEDSLTRQFGTDYLHAPTRETDLYGKIYSILI